MRPSIYIYIYSTGQSDERKIVNLLRKITEEQIETEPDTPGKGKQSSHHTLTSLC